jgi:hypothetical protein
MMGKAIPHCRIPESVGEHGIGRVFPLKTPIRIPGMEVRSTKGQP